MSSIHKHKNLKLHICCGDVYLRGYKNIDIRGVDVSVLRRKKMVNPNETTLNKYYKYSFGSLPRQFIIDINMDVSHKADWALFSNKSIDEIVMISSLEHFTLSEAKLIVKEIYRVLKLGGKFLFDFPDIVKGVEDWVYRGWNWEELMQLIYCNHKNAESVHKYGYCHNTIKDLLDGAGYWKVKFKEIVKHDYPMIGVEAIKWNKKKEF